MKRNVLIFILSFIIISLLVIIALYTGYLRFNYPSEKEFPIQGIDISNHQGNIRWKEIDKNKVKFVYIKATEGEDFKDKQFSHNWIQAKEQNILVGAYHFFTFCKSGGKQADNFIATVPRDTVSLPPVIDLEYGGNCKLTASKEEILKEIEILENKIFQYYNKKPILYVTQEFYEDFLLGKFKDNPLWFRDIYNEPKLKDGRKWLFWQYANRGHLKGIDTYVDLNVYKGNLKQFREIIK